MAMRNCSAFGLLLVSALGLLGCGGTSTKPAGSDGGPCYANGTCNAALECVASTCTASHDGAVEVDGNVGVDSAVVGDGAVVTVDSGSADSGSTDSGSADSGSADSGSTDSGRPDGGTPLSNCLYSDTDTGSFSYNIQYLSTQVTRVDVDGVGNENMVAGCGVTDTVEGYDNAFKPMTVTGTTMGISNYSGVISSALAVNNPERVTITVTLTHLSSSIAVDPNDGCVRMTVSVSRPFMTYPPVAGVVTIEDGHVHGQLDEPLGLHFTGFSGPGTVHDLEIRDPIVDLYVSNNFTVVGSAQSSFAGYVFFRPAAADVGMYDSFYSFHDDMTRVYGGVYTNYIAQYLPQYQDIYMAPDGTRQPCSAGHGPNAMSITTRF